jgi:hypothetical protein
MHDVTLLIGNDINNINNDTSWENLLHGIVIFCNVEKTVSNLKTKPFPLLYEEIYLKSEGISESQLKEFIAEKVSRIDSNEIHKRIIALDVSNILTTNYDYSLQKSTGYSFHDIKNSGIIKERKYSIFRHHRFNGTNIWHIHGECHAPQTITLGFEQYGGTIQQIRNYVTTGPVYRSKKISKIPLIKRLRSGDIQFSSWIDLFFCHDVHIFGLSLDFVETDLWWLITYRARCKKKWRSSKIDNSINYYIPERYRTRSIEKVELLKANGINVIFMQAKEKIDYYNSVLDRIESSR